LKLGVGKLSLIDNEINQTTATIRLRAIFDNPKSALWPNEFVKARLLLTMQKDAIVVPAAAIQRGPLGTFVYVVGSDNTASTETVEIDSIQGESAIVSKGLSPGQLVVTDGQNQIRPGSKVSSRPSDKAPAASASASPSASSGSSTAAPIGSAGTRPEAAP
jgi:multidrug efflux system membrane fusion protein